MEITKRAPLNLVSQLKTAASQNPTMSAVLHLFAMRQRGRRQITVSALYEALRNEGFKYTREDIEKVLELLSKAGIGTLSFDAKGRLRSLSNIELTLQSIGKAVLGTEERLQKASLPRLRNMRLPHHTIVPDAPKAILRKKPTPQHPSTMLLIDGHEFILRLEPVPKKGGHA